MSTSIAIIRDFLDSRSTTLMYTKEQKDGLLALWDAPDPLLIALQHQPVFTGKLCLKDLDPYHFRVLLALNLNLLGDLSNADRLDPANLTMRSFDWVMMGLINCLERRTDAGVAVLTINRVSVDQVLMDAALTMNPLKMPKPRGMTAATSPGPGPDATDGKFRVIVDNRRD